MLSTFTVTSTSDSGAGSLRTEIGLANSTGGADTIVFDPTVFATPQKITLTSGQLTLTDTATTTIIGPGSSLLSISGNNASGVFAVNPGASGAMSGLTITGGKLVGTGGAGVNNRGTLTLTNCVVSGNTTTGLGGGLYNYGSLTLANTTVTGNSAGNGGGIGSTGYPTITLINCVVSGNTASGIGGGVDGGGNTKITIVDTVINNNKANTAGGILVIGGHQTLTNCTISGNSAVKSGGFYALSSSSALIDCTISGNSSTAAGGGVYSRFGPALSLTDCTVSGNTASTGAGFFLNSPNVTLTNCTVSSNTASTGGGGLTQQSGTVNLGNTIVAANNSANDIGPDAFGTFVSLGNNLIGKTDGSTGWVGSDLKGTIATPLNPRLAPLANNGGLIQSLALLPGSPAINAGNSSLFSVSEMQDIAVTGSSGTFTLTFNGQTTGSLVFNASAAQIQTALNGLTTIGGVAGSVTVTQVGSAFTIAFGGSLANQNLPQMTALGSGGASITVVTSTDGNTDLRGAPRNNSGSIDIGAYELQIYTVTTTADTVVAGQTNLRQAITGANLFIGSEVLFAIPGGGPYVISPTTTLPSVAISKTLIDGTSQPGYSGSPIIQILGTAGDVNGLVLAAGSDGSTVQGLVIAGFTAGSAIQVLSNDDLIRGDFLGTDATGNLADANSIGLSVQGLNTTIGGSTAASLNVISGNSGPGIDVKSGELTLIEGNLIGVSADGSQTLGNGGYGILVEQASTGTTIGGTSGVGGNTIDGTTVSGPGPGAGIGVLGGSIGTVIQGNFIGAVAGFGNAGAGIYDPSDPVVIGGAASGASNLIAFNGGPGISLGYVADQGSSVSRNVIVGNTGLGIAINFAGNTAGYGTTNNATVAAANVGAALDAPAITSASIRSGLLTVSGFSRPGAILEFYVAPSTNGSGQAAAYLGTFTEGSAQDSNAGTGSYSNASGSDPNASKFTFDFAIPAGYAAGTVITAISEGTATHPSVSEYGIDATSDAGGGLIGPILSTAANQTILAGQMFSYQGTFGDNSSSVLSATVDYDYQGVNGSGVGDPGFQTLKIDPFNPTQPSDDQYTPTSNGDFTLSQLYKTPGVYTIVVNLSDGLLGSSTSLTVTVLPAPVVINDSGITLTPLGSSNTATPVVVKVDQGVTLSGSFTEPDAGVVPSVEAIWGDGTVTYPVATQNPHDPSSYSFTGNHSYVTPSTGALNNGLYPVAVIIQQTVGGQVLASGTTEGLFYAEVLDKPPTSLILTPSTTTVTAGKQVNLSGSFVAPTDPNDVYQVVVNWGDGSTPTSSTSTDGVTTFNLAHVYSSDQIGSSEFIQVSVTDQYDPLAPASASTSVNVVAPAGSVLSISTDKSKIVEGNSVNLTGTLAAAFPSDPQDVTINWGDGTTQSVLLGANVSTIPSMSHTYASHPTGASFGSYAITATSVDVNRPGVAPVTAMTSIEVDDIAPGVSNLVLKDIRGNTLTQVPENTTVVLTGTYTNPEGINAADAITINWGDGSLPTAAAVNSSTHTFTISHTFGTIQGNPNGTIPLSSQDLITATATEMGTTPVVAGSAAITLGISHAAPTVAIMSGGFSNGLPVLTVPNANDTGTVTYAWTVNGTPVTAGTSYLPSFTPGMDTSELVNITATDSYGATTTVSATVELLDDNMATVTVQPAIGSSTSILAIDLNPLGGRTIAASNVMIVDGVPVMVGVMPATNSVSVTTPITFDAVGTNETFIGDQGNDTFNLHADGVVAYGMGGNNDFAITPNCTIEAFADSGQNTLDFSSSSFGVTFDLSQTNGTFQNVEPSNPGAGHIVMADDNNVAGTFSTLVCSSGGQDNITAASNSTIVGSSDTLTDPSDMSQADTVNLASSSNVAINAGGTGEIIMNASGSNATGVTVNGDASTSAMVGQSGVEFDNMGTASGVNFLGDTGSTIFQNNPGAVAGGSVSFSGDSGSATFENGSLPSTTISFSGDTDSGTFTNGSLPIGTVVSFSGDTGSTTFMNNPGAVSAASVSFSGDTGSAIFVNGSPSGLGSTVSYSGDDSSTTFSNVGTTTVGSISFSGDSGTATFMNSPGATTASTVSFSGDSGSTLFVNGVGGGSTVSFSGDTSSSTLTNGSLPAQSTVSFSGDTGSSTFMNNPGAVSAGTVSFSGDTGSTTFVNGAPTGETVSFTGDSGSTTLGNPSTSTPGMVSFSGDAGSATFVNNPGATSLGTVSFSGDTGSQTFMNNTGASTGGTVAFSGDSGSTTFMNGLAPVDGSTISFSGDDGSTTFANGTITSVSTISFSGDMGSTIFQNNPNATVAGTVSFSGDTGSTLFVNGVAGGSMVSFSGDTASTTFTNGSLAAGSTVSFSSDSGSTTFMNNPGATTVGTVSFSGDTGSQTFLNGSAPGMVSVVSFSGDDGSTTFSNVSTTTLGPVSFSGDSGSQTFMNDPGATTVGMVSFSGDSGSQTFDNLGTVNSTNVSFSGDQGQSTFVNGSILGAITPFSFSDTASTMFTNGTVGAGSTVSFSDDMGSSTFMNGAASGSSVSFSGDGDSTTFVNGTLPTGATVSFSGDAGSSIFQNEPGATVEGTVSFSGDMGSTLFVNGVGGGSTVSFSGDSDSATYGNGTIASTSVVSFSGDTGTSIYQNNPGAISGGAVSFSGDTGSSIYQNGSPSGTGSTVSFSGDTTSTTFQNSGTILTGTVSFLGDTGSSTFQNDPGAVAPSSSVSFSGDLNNDTLLNAGLLIGDFAMMAHDGGNLFLNGEVLVNGTVSGRVEGKVTIDASSGPETFANYGSIDDAVLFDAGTGMNSVYNAGLAGSLSFVGNTLTTPTLNTAGQLIPSNQFDNQESGLSSLSFIGGAGGNLLINNGQNVGPITFQSLGLVNYLENFGNGVTSITMTAGAGQEDVLTNAGNNVGSIHFVGGGVGGGLSNAGSDIASIVDSAGAGNQYFSNSGSGVGIQFIGSVGQDFFYDAGPIFDTSTKVTGSLNYVGSSGTDELSIAGDISNPAQNLTPVVTGGTGSMTFEVGPGATISGLTLAGGLGGNLLVEDYGSILGSTINASLSASAGLVIGVSGTIGGGSVYDSAQTAGILLNQGDSGTSSSIAFDLLSFGIINGFNDFGAGAGLVGLYDPTDLDPNDTTHISETHAFTYHGGSTSDTLVIAPDARNVSGVTFDGGSGVEELDLDATGTSNVTFNGGSGFATFESSGDGGSGLTLNVGSGGGLLDNSGNGVTGLLVQAGSTGDATLYNSGNNFGTLDLIGGAGTNALTNTGQGLSGSVLDLIAGTGENTLANDGANVGSMILTDPTGINGDDILINDGNGVGRIFLSTNAGFTTLDNSGTGVGTVDDDSNGGSPTINNTGGIGSLVFDGGTGIATLNDSGSNGSGASIVFNGGGLDDIFADTASAGTVEFNAAGGSSQVVIGMGSATFPGATGTITLIEGSGGNNTYAFTGTPTLGSNGSPQVAVTIEPPTIAGTGVDSLDFSSYSGGGLTLDLMRTTPQTIAGGLTLTLASPTEITSVIGTEFTNTIYGNTLADTLDSAALPDPSAATTYATPAVPDARTQWAYLDFTDYSDPIAGTTTHVYSAAEETTILDTLEADYWGPGGQANPWFNVDFATSLSQIPSGLVASDSYATLDFNRTPSNGQPGGESSEVDFGNLDPGGYASIQVNGLLGGPDEPAYSVANFDTLSAKIAAHEFAHLQGVRHSDAYGPIGYGIHTPPGASDVSPSFTGPSAAFETFDHIISSPASQGTDRFNDLRPLDLGPREAIKLAFGEQGTIVPQTTGDHSSTSTAMAFPLSPLYVPNTDVTLPDIEQGMNLQVVAGAVSGSIVIGSNGLAAPDYFSFTGKAGQDFTFETESQELPSLANGGSVDTVIEILDSSGNPVPYYGGIALNDDQLEGTDSLLDDVILPSDGTYYVKVTSYAAPANDPDYNPNNPASPLYAGNTDSILNPLNPNYSAYTRAAYIAAGNGTATGSFDLFIYRESQSDPTAENVNNTLVARGGGSTLASSGQGDTLMGGAGTDRFLIAGNAVTLSTSVTAPTVDLLSAGLFNVTITDAGVTTVPYSINYGDGTSTTGGNNVAQANQPLAISHLYSTPGQYTVTVSYTVDGDLVEIDVPVTINETLSPVTSITAVPTNLTTAGSAATFTAILQNPYPSTNYTATWTFTSPSLAAPIVVSNPVTLVPGSSSFPMTLNQVFTTAGAYSVQLVVTNDDNTSLSSRATFAANVPSTINVIAQVATSVSFTLPSSAIVYSSQGFAPPTATVDDINDNMVAGASVTYSYAKVVNGVSSALGSSPIDVGSYTVTISYAGDSTHFASSASANFSITPATLTVKIANATKTYGVNDATALSGTVSGLQGSSDSATVSYTSTGSSPAASVGSYAITASVSFGSSTNAADYTVITEGQSGGTSGTLTITQAAPQVIVTASNATFTGSSLTGSPTTTVNGTVTTTGITYTYTVLGSTIVIAAPTQAGSYTVTGTYAGSTNFASGSASANFTISAASTSVTGSASGAYFGNSTFTATVTSVAGTPSGSVDFYDTTTATDLGSAGLNGSGKATLNLSVPLESGSQSIGLTFTSSSVDFAATSGTIGVNELASIYVLNPTAGAAFSVSGSSSASVPGTIQVASNSSSAIVLSGNSKLGASTIGVFGGTSVSGSSSFGVTPTKDTTAPADPLANLPVPSASGMKTYAAVNLGGASSLTIAPGIYPSITVGGSGKLTLQPGIYVITGGGFSVSGAGIVSGTGVLIYNAGSNYNGGSGSSFGAFANSGSGALNLTAQTTGPYAGIVIFQSRDNNKTMSLTGAAMTGLNGGTVYVPDAMLSLSGSTQVGGSGQSSTLIVNELTLSGATGAYQLTDGSSSDTVVSTFNWITNPVLTIAAEDDTGNGLDPNEIAELGDAMTSLNQALGSFGVNLSWAAAGTNADVTVHFAATSPQGGVSDGVLGYTTAENDVYFVTGWSFYTSSDPSQIASNQYDFETLAIHELGHTLGLGESQDPNSVMYEYLSPGTVRRTFTDSNLSLIDTNADRFMKVEDDLPASSKVPGTTTPTVSIPLLISTGPSILAVAAFDSVLASLDPEPDATSKLASYEVRYLDDAIESVVQESFIVPLEVVQDVIDSPTDAIATTQSRKPMIHIA